MDALLKALAAVVPFIGRCPTWFQMAVIVWLALTAILGITGFVLATLQPPSLASLPAPAAAPQATSQTPTSLAPSSLAIAPNSRSFAIIQPQEGALVEAGDTVQFVSPYGDLNHYVIVTPLQSPTRWVVDGPLRASAGEQQHGNARFGDTVAGRGERFSLQILATSVNLSQGALKELPADSKFSQAIKVIRAR
jgi:hypothetical protein